MPRFTYKAKKGPSEVVQGEIDAENEDAALGKIAALGLIPVRLISADGAKESPSLHASASAGAQRGPTLSAREKNQIRISHRDLNIFTRQFAILLRANVPLLKIFDVLQTQAQHEKFRRVLQDIQTSLREGGSLSEALAAYPKIFSQMYVNMVHAGEVSGTLDQVLMRLAAFVEKEAEIISRVQSAMIYPLFLFCAGVGTIFILLTFVMPRLIGLFADLGTEPPAVTLFLIRVSRFCQKYWVLMTGGIALAGTVLRTRGLSSGQQKILDSFLIRLPLFGEVIKKAEIGRFLRSLELLYENGIPLYKAVEIAARTISNRVIRAELEKVPGLLEGGATLAKSLQQIPYISVFAANMVSVGEESGQLGPAVSETAAFFEQETQQFIKLATSLIEPFMILVVGGIVGFIVIAMLLPIFEIHVLAS